MGTRKNFSLRLGALTLALGLAAGAQAQGVTTLNIDTSNTGVDLGLQRNADGSVSAKLPPGVRMPTLDNSTAAGTQAQAGGGSAAAGTGAAAPTTLGTSDAGCERRYGHQQQRNLGQRPRYGAGGEHRRGSSGDGHHRCRRCRHGHHGRSQCRHQPDGRGRHRHRGGSRVDQPHRQSHHGERSHPERSAGERPVERPRPGHAVGQRQRGRQWRRSVRNVEVAAPAGRTRSGRPAVDHSRCGIRPTCGGISVARAREAARSRPAARPRAA